MNEQLIKKHFSMLHEAPFKEIEKILKNYDYETFDAIGCFISSIFHIDSADMLSKDRTISNVEPRWLWWYALYFMCHKTYKEIADLTAIGGNEWETSSIKDGINSIQQRIDTDAYLRGKWVEIKRMIYLKYNPNNYTNNFSDPRGYTERLKIYKSKNVEVEILDLKD